MIDMENLVREWFRGMDEMTEKEFFHNYITKDTKFITPDGNFEGIDGFDTWYMGLKKLVKPNNEHKLIKINSSNQEDGTTLVEMEVEVRADTYDGSPFNLKACEAWVVGIDGRIKEYRITSVEEL